MQPPPIPAAAPQSRSRIIWIAAFAAFALVAAGVFTWNAVREHPAETALKEFFAALQDKDAEAALALVGQDSLAAAPRPVFQEPEALGGDWELLGTEMKLDGPAVSYVTAEFSTLQGTQEAEYHLESSDSGDTWKLRDPFVEITVGELAAGAGPFDYLQVNGAVAPINDSVLTLFPGVYRFYEDVPGVVDFTDPEPVALFGREPIGSTEIIPPAAVAEPEAVAAVQQQVDDRITECANATRSWQEDCPFALFDGTVVYLQGGSMMYYRDAEWSIEAYPTIAIAERGAGGEGMFVLESADPAAAVSLTATGYDGAFEAEFTTTCTYDFSVWSLRLVADDEGNVSFAFDDEDAASWVEASTCDIEPDE